MNTNQIQSSNNRPSLGVLATVLIGLYLMLYLSLGFYTEIKYLLLKLSTPGWLLQDFGFYQRALMDALGGGDPYRIRGDGTSFIYPPTAFFIIEPFSAIPSYLLRPAVFIMINMMLACLMTYGIARYYHYSINQLWYWFPIVLGFAPFLELLQQGQINIFTEFGIFMLFYWSASWPIVAAVGLALAAGTKLTPLVFIGYLFAIRSYKTLVIFMFLAVVICGLAVLHYGAGPFLSYPDVLIGLLRQFDMNSNSQAFVTKLPFVRDNIQMAQTVLTSYMVLLLVASGSITLFIHEKEPLFILVGLVTMLSPNILWYHHYVFFLAPLLVWMAWSRLRLPVVAWCLGGLLLIQIDRWQLTYGLLTHIFGHISILLILAWQLYRLYQVVKPLQPVEGMDGYAAKST